MNILRTILFCFFLFPSLLIGQNNTDVSKNINNIAADPALPIIIKDYYNNKFVVSDDSITGILLDSLTTKNDYFLPLYLTLFNQIINQADGALAEMMGEYCFKIIYNYPYDLFDLFKDHAEYLEKYALLIGYEFYFKEQGTSDLQMTYSEFYNYLKKYFNDNDTRLKPTLRKFDDKVKVVMNNMD